MPDNSPSSYDEIPYNDNCFPYTHPDNLATVAMLFGLNPPPIESCRVLELGCAGGGNVIPMALGLPQASFVGIDLSPRQIKAGQATVNELGFKNIQLKALSITDIDPSFGQFDYIICHGVYSWVPQFVREKILQICSENLAPDGVAYISYNTFPGWHARGLVRDLFGFHVRNTNSAIDRVTEAREFLQTLLAALPEKSSSYARILATEAKFLQDVNNSYFYHEHLEEVNSPCYVNEFLSKAKANGLQFLAEAFSIGLADNLPPETQEVLNQWATDRVAREQYLDFLTNRTFRRTLLCHEALLPAQSPCIEALSKLQILAAARPESDSPDSSSDKPEAFHAINDSAKIQSNHPVVKTTLMTLFESWPRAFSLAELSESVVERLKSNDVSAEVARLPEAVMRCYLANLIGLHIHRPKISTIIDGKPIASQFARLQANSGARVANLQHRTVELDDVERLILRHLDGRHDREALRAVLMRAMDDGTFNLYHGEQAVNDPGQVRIALDALLEERLFKLAGHSLLIPEIHKI